MLWENFDWLSFTNLECYLLILPLYELGSGKLLLSVQLLLTIRVESHVSAEAANSVFVVPSALCLSIVADEPLAVSISNHGSKDEVTYGLYQLEAPFRMISIPPAFTEAIVVVLDPTSIPMAPLLSILIFERPPPINYFGRQGIF